MILKCSNLSKKYGKFMALDDVSLEFDAGSIVGLLGPNGSGKTTFLKAVNSLLPLNEGEISFEGHPISYKDDLKLAYLPDKDFLNQSMNANQLADLFKDFYPDFDEEKFFAMISKFEVPKDKSLKHLSKGMKKKVQIALIISRKAEVYFLDEPFGGIDIVARKTIIESIVENYNPDACLIVSTHLINEVENILDRAILLKDGRVIADMDCEKLREDDEKSISTLYMEVYNA